MLGSHVLSQIPLPQGCEVTLWALNSLSLSMLLFDVRRDRRPPPKFFKIKISKFNRLLCYEVVLIFLRSEKIF